MMPQCLHEAASWICTSNAPVQSRPRQPLGKSFNRATINIQQKLSTSWESLPFYIIMRALGSGVHIEVVV